MGQPYPPGAGLRLYTSEGIESKSIRVTSDNAITVQVQSSIYAASESFTLQPTSVLGKSYVVASYPSSGGIMAGMFAIQATQAATTVTVRTTKTVGTLFQAGVPYTFVLQAGEAFQLRDTSGQDLTGSLITSDKPVAVYSGSNGANVPGGIVAANPLTEQLVPVERWGYTYYSAGFATKTADSVYRVLAYKNNTPIAIDGVVVATIQKGEFYEFSSPNGIQISSTKPIQPFEYCTGGSADFVSNSDPSMTAIPAVTSYSSTYLFYAANDPSFYTGLFVNLYVPTSALSSMRLNGVAIPLSNFGSIGSSSYSVAKLAVPAGKNLITSTTGAKFGAINYGFGSYDSFSSPLGGDLPENFVTNVTPLPASSLVATTISSSQINLAWADNSSNEDGFRIERKLTTPGSEWSEIASVSANSTTYQNTGLNKLTTYVYRVKAYADFDSTPSNEAQATTLDAPPTIPTNLAAQVLSQTEIKLTWNDISDNEQGFKVQRKQGTGAWADVQTLGSGITTWTNTGLTKKTTYSYRVYAYNAVGNSDYSNVASATTKDSIPNSPTSLAATAPSWNLVSLSWTDASDNEDGFKLERRQGAGAWVQIASLLPNTSSYSDGTVQASTNYSYRVLAYNTGGDSTWSNEASVTTPAAPIPSAPTGLSATAASPSSISLSWTDTSPVETGFTIQRTPQGTTNWVSVASIGANITSWSDAGLSASTAYSYRVCAFNATGSSGWSNLATATTAGNSAVVGPAGAPAVVYAVAADAHTINIYWSPSAQSTAYTVYRRLAESQSNTPIATIPPTFNNQRIQKFIDTNLTTGQVYFYSISATAGSVQSLQSGETSEFPDPAALPLNGSTSAILSWAASQVSTESELPTVPPNETQVLLPDGTFINGYDGSVTYEPEAVQLRNEAPQVGDAPNNETGGGQITLFSNQQALRVRAQMNLTRVRYTNAPQQPLPNLETGTLTNESAINYIFSPSASRFVPNSPVATEGMNLYVGFASYQQALPPTWPARRRNNNVELGFQLNHYGDPGGAPLRLTPYCRSITTGTSNNPRREISLETPRRPIPNGATFVRADIAPMGLDQNQLDEIAWVVDRNYAAGEVMATLSGTRRRLVGFYRNERLRPLSTGDIRAKIGIGLDQTFPNGTNTGNNWRAETGDLYFKTGHFLSNSRLRALVPTLQFGNQDTSENQGAGVWQSHLTNRATFNPSLGVREAIITNN